MKKSKIIEELSKEIKENNDELNRLTMERDGKMAEMRRLILDNPGWHAHHFLRVEISDRQWAIFRSGHARRADYQKEYNEFKGTINQSEAVLAASKAAQEQSKDINVWMDWVYNSFFSTGMQMPENNLERLRTLYSEKEAIVASQNILYTTNHEKIQEKIDAEKAEVGSLLDDYADLSTEMPDHFGEGSDS